VRAHTFPVACASLADDGWVLASEAVTTLLARLKASGTPLGTVLGGKIFYGIKTGLNEAFVVDEETRSCLIAEDPGSEAIIKPFLAGRDIKRYEPLRADKYLILFPKGWTEAQHPPVKNRWTWLQQTYPAIASYLAPFEAAAKKRADQGDYWWELRACDYYREFEKPKIMFPDISQRGNFQFDETGGTYCVNTCYILGTHDLHLFGIINSSLFAFIYSKMAAIYRGGYLRFFTQTMEQFPIPVRPVSDAIEILVRQQIDAHASRARSGEHEKPLWNQKIAMLDERIDAEVYALYGLSPDEIDLVEGRG